MFKAECFQPPTIITDDSRTSALFTSFFTLQLSFFNYVIYFIVAILGIIVNTKAAKLFFNLAYPRTHADYGIDCLFDNRLPAGPNVLFPITHDPPIR